MNQPIVFSRISIKDLASKRAAFHALFGRMPRIFAAGMFRSVQPADSTIASVTVELARIEVVRLVVRGDYSHFILRGSDVRWTLVPSIDNPGIYYFE